MSRAEPRSVPPPPRLWRVLREAASDFYFNSWRFLGANILLGMLVVTFLLASLATPWGLLLAVLLVLPAAGTMRMATRLIRDFHTDLGDFVEVVRRPWPVLGIGLAQLAVTVVLVGDILIAGAWGTWPGTFLLVGAMYGLVVLWAVAVVAWPLLLDPERDGEGVRTRLRLALVILLTHPVRTGGFTLLMGALLLASALLIAPLITFAVGVIWLAIARWVLPVADRVEGRRTVVVVDGSQ
ncbi:MAG: hypothetical protein ACRDGV_05520 [Candidatus Limnocylindria bacterium]